ncbi:MAG: phosphate acyltransferase PlsX [Candidatus Brocadiae bacterium]|nr:phosphate acyltransferase PlsX [Candidatus Brocadiia bacterium]
MRIALDAMGGDHAPAEIVRGALEYAAAAPGDAVLLVGQPEKLQPLLGGAPANVKLVPAAQVIEMGEHPARALKEKRESSIVKCVGMCAQGMADGWVGAGNTGACVGGSLFLLGHLPGVLKAGIATPLPTRKGECTVIDAGANILPKPQHLLQYALMGALYAKVRGIAAPRVGILNIGEEEDKGTELVQAARDLVKKTDLNYIGFVEPTAIAEGAADVVVADGFAGNILLKAWEGMGELMLGQIDGPLRGSGDAALVALADRARLLADFASYGGAPLLGVKGVTMIAHGRSNAKAIFNALKRASDCAREKIVEKIAAEISRYPMSA